jgi:signal transduction histidine kinase
MTTSAHLLVVDDSRADRELTTLTLGAAFPEAAIHQCADPLAVEGICNAQTFDCVLLDYNMPRMDGMALTGELRTRFAYLPIILMTSVGDELLATRALHSGVSDYLPKSHINARSIQRTVERAIESCSQARIIDEQKAELENFAYALAHDFKQPIRQISTFTRMISDEIHGGEFGGVLRHLAFLGDAARRLSDLVDVMVQYTLLNQPPELSNFQMGDALDSVRASITPYLAERTGEFATPAVTPLVRGNQTLMVQVLQNLVVNGLQYNKSPVPRVEIKVAADADAYAIDVVDNGIGIDAEYLTEVFKPLARLHTSSEYPGSGLGLTLARKAILAQGGAIWCESTPGAGSTFHIRLPVAKGARPRARRQPPTKAR